MAQLFYKVSRFAFDKVVLINLIITLGFQLILWAYLLVNYQNYADSTFLHYTVGVGVDLVGSKLQVFLVLIVGLIAAFANAVFGYIFFEKAKLTSYFFITFTNVLHLFLLIAGALVVSLNI